MNLGLSRKVDLPYDEAVLRTRAALKEQGFGVLTEIDVRGTLKEKIGADFRRYVILGACNPPLAHRALSEALDVGLLLPCNVVVYEEGEGSVVSAVDPSLMTTFFKSKELEAVAAEARQKLARALDKIAPQPETGR
ncbi:MAG: DUF302 domain-containing protein [Candidatus Eisenbacteria bacterium]